jgi:hypothetical protein
MKTSAVLLSLLIASANVYAEGTSNNPPPKTGTIIHGDTVYIITKMSRSEHERIKRGFRPQPAKLDLTILEDGPPPTGSSSK